MAQCSNILEKIFRGLRQLTEEELKPMEYHGKATHLIYIANKLLLL